MLIFFIFCKKCKKSKKGIDNFHYRKYNYLVMQLGISKSISKRKKESALIMRKQTKLVAVLSTAALLALGASMSSFAATGWQEENGTWVYYDKNGDTATETWAKSGDNWFYLNDDGEMATDVVVEYKDNYYYVDENGAMVANKWVSVENEDYDGEDEPINYWYYFGANGKAFTGFNDKPSFKTVNGKKYTFDDEGRMQYGWIGEDGKRKSADDAWKEDNGKKMVKETGKTINGKKYSFDEHGRMNAEWVIYDATPTTSTVATGSITKPQGTSDYTTNWRYYGSPEDGARVTKGWFKVVPDINLHEGDYDDDEDSWYYSDKDGKLVASEIKTINGKKYAFDDYGRMKDGLRFIKFVDDSTTKIDTILSDDDRSDAKFDTEDNFKDSANTLLGEEYHCYYFGSGSDGAMKTNKQTVEIDGDNFNFLFNKSGSYKGAGKTGVDDSKYYLAGMLLKADKDDKYSVIKIETVKDAKKGTEGAEYSILTTDDFIKEAKDKGYATPNAEKLKGGKYTEYYDIDYKKAAEKDNIVYKLVNTSGSVQKSKTKAKDGNDRCYVQSSENIIGIFVED
jgi:glucan-binding YG repeat protein